MRISALAKVIRLLKIAQMNDKNPLLSRRELLKKSAALTAVLPLSGLLEPTASAFSRSRKKERTDPVLILGGGVAGLTAAYRLHKKGIPCAIYEASERLGGRMYTVPNFNSDQMFCELGGEAVDSDHTALKSLCAELGVGIQNLEEEDQGLEKDIFYAEGKVISTREMLLAFQPLALQIEKDLKEVWGDEPAWMPTYKDRSNPVLVKYDTISLADYLYGKKGVEKWVLDLISMLYVCEFGLDAREQSSLNFLTMIALNPPSLGTAGKSAQVKYDMELLGISDEKFRIQGGSSALCNALVKVLEGKVPIYLGHPLIRVTDQAGVLSFGFKKDSIVEVAATQAICTIPFSTLRFVEGIQALDLNSDLKKSISELGYGTASKWAIGFKSRFWRKDKKYPSTGSFLSVERQQFSETSRMQKGTSGILTRVLAGTRAKEASYGSLEKDLTFLNNVYPGAKKYFDNKHILMPWSQFPWSKGCYSCMKPGQYTAFNGLAEESQLNGRLLFAGEHVSVDYGGFMNGAIESSNASANKMIQSRAT
jgi:monoamine oxidase